jgi:hypothetical protein
MLVSQKNFNTIEDPIKVDKTKNKTENKQPQDETKIVRETTIKIREEINIKGNKTGSVPTNLPIFEDQKSNVSVESVKDTLDDINDLKKTDRIKIVKRVSEFDKKIEKLELPQLIEVSKYVNELMADTDDNDDILAELNNSILERIEEKSSKSNIPLIPEGINIPNNIPSIDVDLMQPNIEPSTNKKLNNSNEELDWAFELQDKILNGYKPTPEESHKYDLIFNSYKV